MVYKIRSVEIAETDELFGWCEHVTSCSTNLYNAVRFRQRQLITASNKKEDELSDHEKDVLAELKFVDSSYSLAENGPFLCYEAMNNWMHQIKNPDYTAKGLSAQTAQQIVKQCVSDMDNFLKALVAWKANPSKFTGKPNFPGYRKKKGHSTVIITNQDASLYEQKGKWYLTLVFARKIPLCVGKVISGYRLKQVTVSPIHGRYQINATLESEEEQRSDDLDVKRMCSIDYGVDNLMAVVNNFGEPSLLFKGGVAKSINQYYNKQMAKLMSEQTKGTTNKFVPTKESMTLTRKRNHSLHDLMNKSANMLIEWCRRNKVGRIVVGHNAGWKQKSNLGKTNNQNFVQLPFSYLTKAILWRAERFGIDVVLQEESYTSKADFLSMDDIPVYKEGDQTKYTFSGHRRPTHYKEMYKKDGFRGLYMSGTGKIVNSDLNGAANIMRKAYPSAFTDTSMPNFDQVIIIKHPDYDRNVLNHQKQCAKPSKVSKTTQHRRHTKILAAITNQM